MQVICFNENFPEMMQFVYVITAIVVNGWDNIDKCSTFLCIFE